MIEFYAAASDIWFHNFGITGLSREYKGGNLPPNVKMTLMNQFQEPHIDKHPRNVQFQALPPTVELLG